MPAGEFIAETVAWILVELIFHGLFYWTGFLVLKILTFGTLRLAPVGTLGTPNRSRKGRPLRTDWSIWLRTPGQAPRLRAEITGIIGFLAWITAGLTCLACL